MYRSGSGDFSRLVLCCERLKSSFLNGLVEKLDYLNDGDPYETRDDLGITGIWLMPISQSLSYHGLNRDRSL